MHANESININKYHARFLIFPMMYYVLLSKKYNLHKKISGEHIQNLSFSSILYTNVTKNQCFIENALLGFF